jgi:hypothetical protein
MASRSEDHGSSFNARSGRIEMTKLDQIENAFIHHPPRDDQVQLYDGIRRTAMTYAKCLIDVCPESRELSLALTKLEEVVFWANAAIARNGKPK